MCLSLRPAKKPLVQGLIRLASLGLQHDLTAFDTAEGKQPSSSLQLMQ
jgi:hypothetical protein